MNKKAIIIGIILLGICLIPLAGGIPNQDHNLIKTNPASTISMGDILYVGGSGEDNYTKIQDAIDNASNGDTVFVYNGTYYENLQIGTLIESKKIDLIGEDREITIIQGRGGGDPVITVMSIDVEINGFTIQGNVSGQDGIIISELESEVLIIHNIITDCAYGIWLEITSERNTVLDNIIMENDFAGIRLQESDRNDITGNTIEDNGDWGISAESFSKQNNFSFNEINGNNGGIKLSGNSAQNKLNSNNIDGNVLEGILIEQLSNGAELTSNNITNNFGGIKITVSSQNIITSNNIQDNNMEGLLLSTSKDNIVTENNFIGNRRQAALRISTRNDVDHNYWDNWVGLILELPIFQRFPKVIGGIPPTLDWHPAVVPFVI
jgi:parallel beta-helix repeat protein